MYKDLTSPLVNLLRHGWRFHVSYPCLASVRQLCLPLLVCDTEVSPLVHLRFGPPEKVNGVLQAQFSLYLRSMEDYVCYCPLHCSPPCRGPYFERRSQEPFARYPTLSNSRSQEASGRRPTP
jgi:hypothetical protein